MYMYVCLYLTYRSFSARVRYVDTESGRAQCLARPEVASLPKIVKKLQKYTTCKQTVLGSYEVIQYKI